MSLGNTESVLLGFWKKESIYSPHGDLWWFSHGAIRKTVEHHLEHIQVYLHPPTAWHPPPLAGSGEKLILLPRLVFGTVGGLSSVLCFPVMKYDTNPNNALY